MHELHETLGNAPSLTVGEENSHVGAKDEKQRDVLFWLFLEGPTFVLPIAGEVVRAAGGFQIKYFNVGRRAAPAPSRPAALRPAHLASGGGACRCSRP